MIADPEQVRKDWKARGFSCEVWVDPPGRVWEDYVHDTDELLMVLEGEEAEKRKFMEQFAPPRLYRQSEDAEKAVITFFDGKELFVVRLVYTDIGIYALEKIEWYEVARGK